jgi:hypothetical protein
VKRGLRGSVLALVVGTALGASGASAEPLTAEQVLQLRQAGVSDETIQKMLEQSSSGSGSGSTLPAPLQQQAEATDKIGAYDLPDGTHILSTGKSDMPNHYYDPTIDSGQSQYPIQVYPFVTPYGPGPGAAGGAAGGGPAPAMRAR